MVRKCKREKGRRLRFKDEREMFGEVKQSEKRAVNGRVGEKKGERERV
jgi:hypothetical protein